MNLGRPDRFARLDALAAAYSLDTLNAGPRRRLAHAALHDPLVAAAWMGLALLASLVVSGLLPFWPDFFALWTHGAIPYDPLLTVTLLIGTSVIAPSILALGYANYSNRGNLVARTKGLQLAVFLLMRNAPAELT